MFTGLIQEKGKILNIEKSGQTIRLTCQASPSLLEDYKEGDSMAVNGTCLTATEIDQAKFSVDIMPETFNRTSFADLEPDDPVNLERPLGVKDRIEGHFVAGHIDTTVRLLQKKERENALVLTFQYPKGHIGEIISQGSITINGVSLTVSQVTDQTFSVSLIPHTLNLTNLGTVEIGNKVNIETDMLVKYLKAQRLPV